jgi:hypothetical protein
MSTTSILRKKQFAEFVCFSGTKFNKMVKHCWNFDISRRRREAKVCGKRHDAVGRKVLSTFKCCAVADLTLPTATCLNFPAVNCFAKTSLHLDQGDRMSL